MARRQFLSYQKRVWKLLKKLANPAIFLEMRLGKTLLAIRWSKTRRDKNLNLIVCPMEVIIPWQNELRLEGIESTPLLGTSDKKLKTFLDAKEQGCSYFITNYEALVKNGKKLDHVKLKAKPTELANIYWDQLILDESTRIRKPTATITKFLLKKINAKRKCILTGLPNPEGAEDFVCQLIFLFGSVLGCTDYYQFRAKHMSKLHFGGYVVIRKSQDKLNKLVKDKCIVLTRKDAGVDYGKVREIRYVYPTAKIIKACKECLEDFELDDKLSNNILAPLSWISRICGGRYGTKELNHDFKLKEIKRLLTSELKGQPVIFAAKHTDELYAIHETLTKLKLKSAVLKGGKDRKNNARYIEKFMAGKLDYLICQPKAIKMGVDLSRADTIIFYSNWHDYEIRIQFEDRIIHPLKKVPVLILDIVLAKTLDAALPVTLQKKGITARTFYDALYEEAKASIVR